MLRHLSVSVLVMGAMLATQIAAEKTVFCYYSSFTQTRQGVGKFLPEDIDPYLCTHLIFAFVDIHPDGTDLVAFNRNDLGPTGLYVRTLALKQKNPALKVLLAVGGWQIGSKPFIPMMQSEGNMRQWIKNVVRYLRQYKFDGFDMDWEFPATRGSPPEDRYRYTNLMKGLYEEFVREALETGQEKLILTMATAAGTFYINTSYESRKLVNYMDYMLLMTYNYHGQWEKRTGHPSGLWKHPSDPPGEQSELHLEWSIDYWLNMGMPKDKLVVGIATYGMTFTLADPRQNGVHSPVRGGGRMGRYTKETGILSYYEICENVQQNGWKTGWISEQGVPYAYGGDQWVGFENVDSIRMKAEIIIRRELSGAFVWSVEMDDFSGVCGDGKYPLLSTITRLLKPYEGLARHAHAETNLPIPAVSSQSQPLPQSSLQSQPPSQTQTPPQPHTPTKTHALSQPQSSPALKVPLQHQPQAESSLTSAAQASPHFTVYPEDELKPQSLPQPQQFPHPQLEQEAETVTSGSIFTRPPKPLGGKRVTWLTKPEWRLRNSYITKTPWWKRTVSPTESATKVDWKTQVNDVSLKETSAAGAQEESDSSINCHRLGSGLFRHPEDCEKFVMCMPGAYADYPPYIMSCPDGTRYDDRIKVCNHAREVEC